ncbi:IS630 family transposase [Sorangium sp. So ce291]|uniref:IS630 family transposase n=1 Tax=Sorangium sp. So ce291 TaxID=3133294 RepID=UPI003F6217C0
MACAVSRSGSGEQACGCPAVRASALSLSQDDEFRDKRDDVPHGYYDTPADEHIICVDEKTGPQALERRYADLPMRPGQPMRREFEYLRHGTLTLMGAFDVRRGKLFGFVSEDHNSLTFVDLLNVVDACYPEGDAHIICDNLSAHDTHDLLDWFDDHPRWKRHFTPKHASWLNQIECAFSILHARVLARGSFASKDELREAREHYPLNAILPSHRFVPARVRALVDVLAAKLRDLSPQKPGVPGARGLKR